jgi:peptide/nickel transport system permease protein
MGRAAATVLNLALVVFLGGFAAAALVRFSPGFDVDENAWNPRISAATREAMRAARARENELPRFYLHYLQAAAHGDFGESDSLHQPVSELLARRAPVTLALVGQGTAAGLVLGFLLAWLAVWPRRAGLALASSAAAGLLLAIPPAVLALAFYFAQAPFALAVALALLPRVFGTLRALLEDFHASPALLAARARGIGPSGLAARYVLGPALPRLAALAGVSLVLAFGLAIPIESLCDLPGVGQLAWQAALARDLPLLCGLALVITFIVASMQSLSDAFGESVSP